MSDEEEDNINQRAKRRKVFGIGADEIFGTEDVTSQIPSVARRQEKTKERIKKRSKIPPHVAQMMGKANRLYSERKFTEAIQLLLNVIQQNANIADPYNILALIFEETNQIDEAIRCYFIAAHLQSRNVDLWYKLAGMSREKGDLAQAEYCYGKIIKVDPEDVEALWKRILLLQEMGKVKPTIDGFNALLRVQPGHIQITRHLAMFYHSHQMKKQATTLLENTLAYLQPDLLGYLKNEEQQNLTTSEKKSKKSENNSSEKSEKSKKNSENSENSMMEQLSLVNMLCELYMEDGSWDNATELIGIAEGGFVVPLDLIVKFGICKAYLGDMTEAAWKFDKLIQLNNNEEIIKYSDLFYNVAETYVAIARPDLALNFYRKLVHNPEFDNPSVWVKMAQCLRQSDQIEAAISMYGKVVAETDDSDAVVALSDLYLAIGKPEEADKIVNQFIAKTGEIPSTNNEISEQTEIQETSTTTTIKNLRYTFPPTATLMALVAAYTSQSPSRVSLLVRKGFLQYSKGNYTSFLEICLPIALDPTLRTGELKRKRIRGEDTPRKSRKSKEDDLEDDDYLENEGENSNNEDQSEARSIFSILGPQSYHHLILRVVQVLAWTQNQGEGGEGTQGGELRGNPSLGDPEERERARVATDLLKKALKYATSLELYCFDTNQLRALKWLGVKAAMKCEDYPTAMIYIKSLCASSPHEIALWNQFCVVMAKSKIFSPSQQYMRRLLNRHPTSLPLHIMAGHFNLTASYFTSLGLAKYLGAYRISPQKVPLLCLSTGVSYLSLVMHRNTPDRHRCILQAFAFLSEYYNLRGRTIEAVYNLARAFHQLGLVQFAVPLYKKALKIEEDENHLKMDVAYNLSLIYKSSGATELARQIVVQYLSV